MKTRFLFPHRFKMIGWILLVPSGILGLAVILWDFQFDALNTTVLSIFGEANVLEKREMFDLVKDNLTDELAGVAFTLAALFAGFSKEKNEDEYITQLRLDSLLWATYVSSAFLVVSLLFIYGSPFLVVMSFNMFTTLIFFLLRYNYMLLKLKTSSQ